MLTVCLFDYSGNYDFNYDMKKGLRPRKSARSAMQHEVMFYALAQVFTLSHIQP